MYYIREIASVLNVTSYMLHEKHQTKEKMLDKIVIKGAREHNLKNIDLELPRDKFIVFTGLSGSGKSTLAFDTIFAESQRRYLESLSSYARQFLGQMQKPNVEHIDGLSPSIAIDQKSSGHNPRSTVGTITEIYDYMRLLWAKIGKPYCPKCGKLIEKMTIDQMVDTVLDLGENKKIEILAPIVRGKKGEYYQLLNDLYKQGYSKARINGKIRQLAEKINLDRYKQHKIEIIIDTIVIDINNINRISEALEQAVKITGGFALVVEQINPSTSLPRTGSGQVRASTKEIFFNQKLSCPECEISFPEIEPRLFSFNSPYGACPECEGLGVKKELDPDYVIPDKNKTIDEGGILPWSYSPKNYIGSIINAACEELRIPTNVRIKDIPKEKLELLMNGPDYTRNLQVRYYIHGRPRIFNANFDGIIPLLKRRYKFTESDYVREEIEHYFSEYTCELCHGARLKKETLLVKIGGKNIYDISRLPITESENYFRNLKLSSTENLIAERILKEIKNRLEFLINVGLDYLTLDRSAITLSGGESQRIRLASQLGSQLMGVIYILDEPSIGLHPRNNKQLIETLKKLRDLGNTVIVIEHDRETIESSDWVTDIGPKAGKEGGKIIANESIDEFKKNQSSITAEYLRGDKSIPVPDKRRKIINKFLSVIGATQHNLKNITVHIPLETFTCITGVSGSGKSTLVNDIIYKTLARKINKALEKPGKHHEIKGIENIKKIILVDQSPIGRTPRSNPATYTGVFTPIRELFAKTIDAKTKGFGLGRFSFNVYGGRCEACRGDGFNKIEMQFLPDVYIPCSVCKGARYNRETLNVRYRGKNIADVLKMTVNDALDFFKQIPQIFDKLKTIYDVGLGYIELGQSATTLSGGEAQRIKLSSELAKKTKGDALYILDEPTTGLHFEDIKKLLEVLNRLVDNNNTVLIIEHNLDVIKVADHIIDLGPEGGEAGGHIVATGTPEELAKIGSSYTGQFLKKTLKNS